MVKSVHKKHHKSRVDGSGLKMVLKVGGSECVHVHKHKKHKKHHHKEKRLKEDAIKTETVDPDLEGSDPSSKTSPIGVSEKSKQSLKKLLDHFLHHLHKKDTESFFARPVNAAEAPGIDSFNDQKFINC